MQRDAFDLLAAAEEEHWWFRGRRRFIEAALARIAPPDGARLLDAGCGSGGNLSLLGRFGRVFGFEYDAAARAVATQRFGGPIEHGALPDAIPFPGVDFDVIGLFDVLEHLEEPVAALEALHSRLVPGGALLLTVPAYEWLWGPHDEYCQHHRRYTASLLQQHLTAAGLVVEYLSYFNSLLLPLAIAQRIKERLMGYDTAAMPGREINELLYRIWTLEQAWIPRRRAPFGLSLLAIARRRAEVLPADA